MGHVKTNPANVTGPLQRSNETIDLKGFVNSKALQNDGAISVGATFINLY